MPRDLKFRAWDKRINKMLQWGNLLHQQNTLSCLSYGFFDVMQFTGLSDKNGVEIYEGDIVRIPLNVKEYFDCEVQFNDGCFDVVQGSFRDYLKVYVANHCVKVVGNIYENPELFTA